MKTQNSIVLSDITNFLEHGAMLRDNAQWHLVWGPFQPINNPISSAISIFCPSFYEPEKSSYLGGTQSATLEESEFRRLLEEFLQKNVSGNGILALEKLSWESPLEADYQTALADILNKIKEQKIKKAVPVVFERAVYKLTTTQKAQLILNLMKAPATLYPFGYWNDKEGILGATPEVLFTIQGNELSTMALAGTCPKSEQSVRADLLNDPKEIEEHQLVVQDIAAFLSSYGAVSKGPMHVLDLPTLWHLKTDIKVLLNEHLDVKELALLMHPTPALGVFPRDYGFTWMQNHPGQQGRNRFGAPLAFIFPERVVCLVAIRNLQWNDSELMIGSGGGVVASSEFAREWRELLQKRQSVKKILGI